MNEIIEKENIKIEDMIYEIRGVQVLLSGLLKSDIAVKVNIEIIDAFVKMRKYL